MAWVTPIIHSVGDILTASDWNISSGDLAFLGNATGNVIGTSEGTTSSTYTDLATVGPSVTLTTGVNALVEPALRWLQLGRRIGAGVYGVCRLRINHHSTQLYCSYSAL